MSSIDNKATFAAAEMQSMLGVFYGLRVVVEALPGERDQNFWVRDQSGRQYVGKIAAAVDRELLVAQNEAMIHLGASLPAIIPTVLETKSGAPMVEIQSSDGQSFLLRLLSYLPGQTMVESGPVSDALWRELGHTLGCVDQSLATFDHPALHYEFSWDLACGVTTVEARLELISDTELRRQVAEVLSHYKNDCLPLLKDLRKSIIHNDANDHNVLVAGGKITGLIDFGDMVFSFTICDLAVCLAYAVLEAPDPLRIICLVAAEYHRVHALTEIELKVLYGMLRMRLAVSACMAARQIQLRPDDDYLAVSQQPIRNTLPTLLALSPETVEATLRETLQ